MYSMGVAFKILCKSRRRMFFFDLAASPHQRHLVANLRLPHQNHFTFQFQDQPIFNFVSFSETFFKNSRTFSNFIFRTNQNGPRHSKNPNTGTVKTKYRPIHKRCNLKRIPNCFPQRYRSKHIFNRKSSD